MKKLIFVLLLALGVSACNDDVVSFGQQTATKIQTESQTANPTSRVARVYIGTASVDSGNFSFDGEFIIVDSARYNLNRLISYQIINSLGTQTLTLYF